MNSLAQEKSPYLLQHADNPVGWLPWGEDAFARARKENKLIFLSIGYSTCHWCHVMAHESFEDESVAALLNQHFVNVKVDREERPDVDLTYMAFVQATTGSGGWPMSVWLTPELTPALGGTYFPPEDGGGRAGFKTVITRIAEAWSERPDSLRQQGKEVVEKLQSFTGGDSAPSDPDKATLPGVEVFPVAFSQIAQQFEPHRGGFGNGPKFPRPSLLNLLARLGPRIPPEQSRHAAEMVESTLYGMALGGMRDHIGGGFHRYSVDTYWHIPHFEKMLYDQAQLAVAYLEAYQTTARPRFAQVARETFGYVLRDLAHPDGGFYSAEDADSLTGEDDHTKSEGAFYVWEESEIDQLLGKNAPIFKAAYGVRPSGNARRQSDPHGELANKNTLFEALSEAELAAKFDLTRNEVSACLKSGRRTLFEAREKRPRPHLDDKVVTAWNGLMISALAKGSRILRDREYLNAAQRAAQFVKSELVDAKGILLRSHRKGPSNVTAFASDYSFLIQGLLDLYEADFDIAWLRWADELQTQFDDRFLDEKAGGYFSVKKSDHSILSIKEDYDGAEPAPNSVAALNLLRLGKMLHRADWNTAATKILTSFQKTLTERPFSSPQLAVALDFAHADTQQIILTKGEGETDLKDVLDSKFLPHAVLLRADGEGGQAYLSNFLNSLPEPGPRSAVHICSGETCQLPITTPEALAKFLEPKPGLATADYT